MKRSATVAATLLLCSVGAAHAKPPAAVEYTVTPVMRGEALSAIDVRIAFKGEASGRTRLDLPDDWAEAHEPWRGFGALAAKGAAISGDGASRTLTHRPGARIAVRYTIGLSAEPDRSHRKGEPVVRPGWFMLHGESLFARPVTGGPARFHWGAAPKGWTLASDLEHRAGRVENLDAVSASVLVGARSAKEVTRKVGAGRLRVVTVGPWPFSTRTFADATARVMVAENEFWRDPANDFLVTVTPLGAAAGGGYSTTGTGKGDAFSIESTTNVDLTRRPEFLAHEYMHTWIPLQVGGFADADEARDYWFSEGFTDFYATRALLRSGVWSLAEVAAAYNEVLNRYGVSSARNLSADAVMKAPWKDYEVKQSPYERGRLLATIWDHEIRRASSGRTSLDDVLRRQRVLASRAGHAPAAALFFEALAEVAPGIDARSDVERHVIRGETIVLPSDVFGGCLTVGDVTVPAFDMGFDVQKSGETGVITGVDPTGAAYAAGLRDGMKRIAREGGRNGDSRVEASYRVAGPDGVERVIRWRPEGRALATFQQVAVPDLTPERRAACTAMLSGR